MPRTLNPLVGSWAKIASAPCSRAYPDRIDFWQEGVYVVEKLPGTSSDWDVGSYEILAEGQVKISMANANEVTYEFLVLGDLLLFRDPQRCEFHYRRVEGGGERV